tara:strand:+ start:62 stop:484 length:423 start_codon:yes stop_codon:yes gene_type:complete
MECQKCKDSILSLENNHINCLKKNLEKEKKYDAGWLTIEKLPNIAALENKNVMIKYLYEEGYYFDPSVYFDAYKKYNIEIIKYLVENNCIGKKKFINFYYDIVEKYKSSEKVLSKILNNDIKLSILELIYRKKDNYIFEL